MISLDHINEVLNNQSPTFTENLAQQAASITQQYFGRTISLYAPLYLSNYCSSHCSYCGFNNHHHITRIKLTESQMHTEMSHVAATGIENILLLTGESSKATPLSYLKNAVTIAKQYFSSIALEIYPMETNQYHELFQSGVDGIAIYQETYDPKRYAEVHLAGQKRDYQYRIQTPKRVALAGIRQISLGILLGLGDVTSNLLALYKHLHSLERNYPGVEYSLSFPRLRKIKGQTFAHCDVNDITFVKILCLTRTLFPRVGINLSTRESERLRNHTLGLGVTRLSAGSSTTVGGYANSSHTTQNPQFDIQDTRSTQEIIQYLKKRKFDPVLTDWRAIENKTTSQESFATLSLIQKSEASLVNKTSFILS